MIIHCTKKLATKLPTVSTTALTETCLLGSWHANHYLIQKRNCVMFCHDQTRYCLLLYGLKKAEFEDLAYWFRYWFLESMLWMQIPPSQSQRVESLLGQIQFDTQCSRSVQGTMRVARQDLEGMLMMTPDVMNLDSAQTAAYLNERPLRAKGVAEVIWPDRAMRSLINAL